MPLFLSFVTHTRSYGFRGVWFRNGTYRNARCGKRSGGWRLRRLVLGRSRCSYPSHASWHRRKRSRGRSLFRFVFSFVDFLGARSLFGRAGRRAQGELATSRLARTADVTARRRRHHQSRTTRVWNVLDGEVQGRFRVLVCAAPGVGFGTLGLIVWREEVLGSGFWLRGEERFCGFWLYSVKKDLDVQDRTHCL